MQKFKDLAYARPSLSALLKIYRSSMKLYREAARNAAAGKSAAQEAYLKFHALLGEFDTPNTIAYIRSTINLKDEFYAKEMKFYGIARALTLGIAMGGVKKFLYGPFRSDLEAAFGSQSLRFFEAMIKTNGLKGLVETVKEDRLVTQSKKVSASCSVEFKGETQNIYGLSKFLQSIDREERREAYGELAKFQESIAPELEDVFEKLVALRIKKAKKLGYANYIDYAYESRMRYDYTPADAAKFREQILLHIVPLCKEIMEAQRKRLGLDVLTQYDSALFFPEGNPVPLGNKDDIVAAAAQMYKELSPETDEFFQFMAEYELFDLETRPNKFAAGYCIPLIKYKAPFIFANFNGTSDDIVVMTHEAGHAFEIYHAARQQKLTEYLASTAEINETHSMTMESFTFPWMELFFGEDADRYREMIFAKRLCSIPYYASAEEFQEEIFKNPGMTANERRQLWRNIEKKYMPWIDYAGNAFFESGAAWMRVQIIFFYPFYSMEYALAQLCAYQYYLHFLEDRGAAWTDYFRLCAAGGSKGYFELLREGNLKNPFEEGVVKEIMDAVKALMETGEKN